MIMYTQEKVYGDYCMDFNMKKMLFIYNPLSGRAQLKNKLNDVIDLFVKNGFEVTVHPTQDKLDAMNQVKNRAQNFDYIVCSGGDGTINEVVDALMQIDERPIIGYMPTGTVNDFASSHKLFKDIIKSANTVVSGEPYAFDVGKFNEEYFTYIAAFGAFTEVAYQTPQQSKNMLGRQAYILEGIKRLANLKSYKMKVEYDEGQIEDEFIFGMVTNSNSIGGFKGISGRGVKLNDGLFEVSLIKVPKNPYELQMIINALLKREPDKNYMYSFRTSKIKFMCDENVEWTLDGEYGGSEKEVVVQNIQQALSILRPKKEK